MTTKLQLAELESARTMVCEDANKLQQALAPFYDELFKLSLQSCRNLNEVGISEMVKISKSVIDFCKKMEKP